jgi:hypothetical protein
MRECNAQTKPITILKVIEPLYVKKYVAKIEKKNKEIMFSRSINEKCTTFDGRGLEGALEKKQDEGSKARSNGDKTRARRRARMENERWWENTDIFQVA